MISFRLLSLLALAAVPSQAASAQAFIHSITLHATKPRLNSLHLLPDGTLLYADAYGIYRVRGQQMETLLNNPVEEMHCDLVDMFGCHHWTPAVYHARPMTADSAGTIYLADPEQHLIQRYDPTAKTLVTVAARAGAPTSLAAADNGGLYFNDPDGCRVLLLEQGTITPVAGTGVCGYSNDGGPATTAEILSVAAIAVDPSGQIFIADSKAGVVRRVDINGIITTIAGTGSPGDGEEGTLANQTPLNGPAGLALDTRGNLYIAETAANRVRMIDSGGVIRTIAGTGEAGHSDDHSFPARARLTAPGCLAVTDTGALLICDSDRIRKLIPFLEGRWIVPSAWRNSPGSWATLLGDFQGRPTLDWSNSIGPDGRLPTSLGGVIADVSGIACVVGYVSPDRIDLLLPANLDTGWQTLHLTLPDSSADFSILIVPAQLQFLGTFANGKYYPAATAPDLSWITSAHPAHPGQIITLYATGQHLTGPVVPTYSAMQVILGSYGHPVLLARPFSLGVVELTVQLPANLPPGDLGIRLFSGDFMPGPWVLPIGSGN